MRRKALSVLLELFLLALSFGNAPVVSKLQTLAMVLILCVGIFIGFLIAALAFGLAAQRQPPYPMGGSAEWEPS
jgi:hypothetical protein